MPFITEIQNMGSLGDNYCNFWSKTQIENMWSLGDEWAEEKLLEPYILNLPSNMDVLPPPPPSLMNQGLPYPQNGVGLKVYG